MAPASDGVVRRVRPEEPGLFRSLRLRALETDPLAFGSTLARESAYPPERWATWTREGAEGERTATWVAETANGEPVGMAGVFFLDGEFHVWGMWVAPPFRGTGWGGRLLDELLRWVATTLSGARVRLEVNPEQEAAVRTYLSRGFRFTGSPRPLGHHPPAAVREMVRPPGA